VWRAGAGEIRQTLAQTDPGAVALHGVALATLDDDPGVRPDAHAFIIDKAPWFAVTDDLPQYLMARLVGKDGHVTGLEIIPELVAQSQADLARLGIDNVSVPAGDGADGHADGAPFDRVMTTAASWDLPAVLFDQVAEGRPRAGTCRVARRRLPSDGSAARRREVRGGTGCGGMVRAAARPRAAARGAARCVGGAAVLTCALPRPQICSRFDAQMDDSRRSAAALGKSRAISGCTLAGAISKRVTVACRDGQRLRL
jgi:hypothetical protein